MQHLYITAILGAFPWKLSQITIVIENITSWWELYTIWNLFVNKCYTIYFIFFLLVFQFFLPGNIKNSTVCKILLMLFSLFFLPVVLVLPTSPDHTGHWTWVALQAHPSCTKTTLSTSMRKCWLWWKRTHLQNKLQITISNISPHFLPGKKFYCFGQKVHLGFIKTSYFIFVAEECTHSPFENLKTHGHLPQHNTNVHNFSTSSWNSSYQHHHHHHPRHSFTDTPARLDWLLAPSFCDIVSPTR